MEWADQTLIPRREGGKTEIGKKQMETTVMWAVMWAQSVRTFHCTPPVTL